MSLDKATPVLNYPDDRRRGNYGRHGYYAQT